MKVKEIIIGKEYNYSSEPYGLHGHINTTISEYYGHNVTFVCEDGTKFETIMKLERLPQ